MRLTVIQDSESHPAVKFLLSYPLADLSTTPRDAATPFRTLRDNLAINPEGYSSSVASTLREQKTRVSSAKCALQLGFANLPKPENSFELIVPDDGEEEEDQAQVLTEEDTAECDA